MSEDVNITIAAASESDGSVQSNNDSWLLVVCGETTKLPQVVDNVDPDKVQKPVNLKLSAIAFVRARMGIHADGGEQIDVVECRAGGRPSSEEKTLVNGFWTSFDAWQPKLVTFNGRGHLLPVLRYASMRHALTASWLHQAGDRWNSYSARFSSSYHVDLMDWLSDQHASPYASLPEVARALDLPSVVLPDDDCRGRAEVNAAMVFLSFIRYQTFTGEMSLQSHDEAADSLRMAIGRRVQESPALAAFAQAWDAIM